MAYVKNVTSNQQYFKPTLKVDYKPVAGNFKIYNTVTGEIIEEKEITFYPLMFLSKMMDKKLGSSQPLSNIFGDKIIMRDDKFKFIGVYKYEKNSEGKFKLINVDTGAEYEIETQSSLFIIGLDGDKNTMTIQINGIPKMDLTVKKENNKDKVKTFNESTILTLKPSEEIVRVGTGVTTKKIHMLDVTGTTDELPADIIEEFNILSEVITKELEYYQKKEINIDEEKSLEDEAMATFGDAPDIKVKTGDEVDISEQAF